MFRKPPVFQLLVAVALSMAAGSPAMADQTAKPIIIGLDADMSSGAAQSGEAIRRGAELAIAQINQRGGVLGRPFQLVVRDHRGNPARGKDNIEELAGLADLVAVIGGIHTPVALAELELIHQHRIVYLGPWAAGTTVVDNGYEPNYVFRVSVRDELAGRYLMKAAKARGYRQPGLLLERTGWGRSNERAFKTAAQDLGVTIAGIEWFNWSIKSLDQQVHALQEAGADVVMLVANPREGVVALQAVAAMAPKRRLPIISHWGITGGNFTRTAEVDLDQVDLVFLQTYSFLEPKLPKRAEGFLQAYFKRFSDVGSPAEIRSPVGTAHAYDLVHLLAMAIERAGSIERPAVRDALERLPRYHGLVKDYRRPFTPKRHDALTAADFSLARYLPDGTIEPVGP